MRMLVVTPCTCVPADSASTGSPCNVHAQSEATANAHPADAAMTGRPINKHLLAAGT